MDGWKLRDELLHAINRWYLILAFVIGGGLLGYVSTFVIPAPYQATADLFVGIDVVRVNEMEYLIPLADEEPLNLDDYKNWQLKQLSDVLYLDTVLEDTLDALKNENAFWKDVTLADFKQMVDIYWFDTGIWRLEVNHNDQNAAEAAVKTWMDVGYKKVEELLVFAEKAASLDFDLQIIKGAGSIQKSQIARLTTFMGSSDEWISELESLTAGQYLSEEKNTDLENWILVYQTLPELWQISVEDFPADRQDTSTLIVWLKDNQAAASIALEEAQKQYDLLIEDREDILPDYHQALDDSLGLSANVVLVKNDAQPMISIPRTLGTNTFSGMGFGLIVWLIYIVIRVKGREDE